MPGADVSSVDARFCYWTTICWRYYRRLFGFLPGIVDSVSFIGGMRSSPLVSLLPCPVQYVIGADMLSSYAILRAEMGNTVLFNTLPRVLCDTLYYTYSTSSTQGCCTASTVSYNVQY